MRIGTDGGNPQYRINRNSRRPLPGWPALTVQEQSHSSWQLWWAAARPRTLTMALVPVMLGSVLAWSEGAPVRWLPMLVAIVAALAIQVGTNLFNDVGDAQRGNDGPERLGPLRVTAAGLATSHQVRRAALLAFGLALISGAFLVAISGLAILLIGIGSLFAGWAYSSGPRPLSHTPWGELVVLVFFGLVAVTGSHYLQSGTVTIAGIALGCALGAQAAAVLLVNNVRDLDADRRAGRVTLAAVLGVARARWVYAGLCLVPFAILALTPRLTASGLVWLALPFSLWLVWRFMQMPVGSAMNAQLVRTAQAQVLLAVFLTADLLW